MPAERIFTNVASDTISTLRAITTIAPTICRLMGVTGCDCYGENPLAEIVDASASLPGAVERCLIVAADAIGLEQFRRCPDIAPPVVEQAPHTVILRAVMPSVTPVCYASMFSGATPDIHGITAYAKPVLTINTLFDVLSAAGKRVAIAAVAGSSIDLIFRNRPIAYFTEPDDAHVVDRALNLIATDSCDCLVVYLSAYDDELHHTTPWSEEAVTAMRQVVSHFAQLGNAIDKLTWRRFSRMIHFAPDHGAHIGDNGKGTHGSDLPDDVVVQHYFGLRAAQTQVP